MKKPDTSKPSISKNVWREDGHSPKPAAAAPLRPDLSTIKPPSTAPAAVPAPPKGDKK